MGEDNNILITDTTNASKLGFWHTGAGWCVLDGYLSGRSFSSYSAEWTFIFQFLFRLDIYIQVFFKLQVHFPVILQNGHLFLSFSPEWMFIFLFFFKAFIPFPVFTHPEGQTFNFQFLCKVQRQNPVPMRPIARAGGTATASRITTQHREPLPHLVQGQHQHPRHTSTKH